jgi:excisionase family DNA binding protein
MRNVHVEMSDRLLSIRDVAAMTRLTVGTLYHLVSQNRIPVVRISRRCLRFRESDLQRWFDALTCEPEHPKENTRRER